MTLPEPAPLILPYQGVHPRLLGPLRSAGAGSAVLGRVTLGAGAQFGPMAVLRADGHVVEAGADLFLGRHATVHIAHDVYGTFLGHGVSVGANAVVHACTVGDDCVIQDDAVVLDGATIGAGSAVAAGSVVFPRSTLPPGHWCAGAPAVPVRPLGDDERRALHAALRLAPAGARPGPVHAAAVAMAAAGPGPARPPYVAPTVTGLGAVQMAPRSSLWFGCVVASEGAGLFLGEHSNVQDNSVLLSLSRPIRIGTGVTVGHNVLMHGCTVGDRVLVGMASRIAEGTVIEHDVLVAAGTHTLPGQVLEGGSLWGGRPARRLAALDDRKRDSIARSARIYCDYAEGFARAAGPAAPAVPPEERALP